MSIITMVKNLLTEACTNKISDIYFLPREDHYHIEARNALQTYTVADLTTEETTMIINYLKFNSGLDISERRRAQKGSFNFMYQNRQIFIRVSAVGDFKNRESMVIRLIYPQELVSPISEEIVESLLPIAKQKGMMLFAGPMGSGKTSLMYALTRQLSYKKRVMCIEDPIEIVEDSFLQLQVNEEAGMTYEELIKTTLRHRPGILIIGEIRDAKTAQQAIRAAICGYTVMSTIHGKSKYSVIQRLQQFGVSDEEIGNAINLISYQRLIPTYDDLQIFLDTLNATEIKEYLENNLKDDRWGQGIRKIYQAGRIDEDVYQEFVNG